MSSMIQLGELMRAHNADYLGGEFVRVGEASPEVIKYLMSGLVVGMFFVYNDDQVDPSRVGPGGNVEWYTDGEWLWPNILAYYVREYDFPIPLAFYEYMIACSWTIPSSIPPERHELFSAMLLGRE